MGTSTGHAPRGGRLKTRLRVLTPKQLDRAAKAEGAKMSQVLSACFSEPIGNDEIVLFLFGEIARLKARVQHLETSLSKRRAR